MQRDELSLHVRPGAHFLGGAHQDADLARPHILEDREFRRVAVKTLNEGNFSRRHA